MHDQTNMLGDSLKKYCVDLVPWTFELYSINKGPPQSMHSPNIFGVRTLWTTLYLPMSLELLNES